MEIQALLGSDIQMQLDECVKLPCTDQVAEKAMELSLRWAERCRTAFGVQEGKAMFGIVQGGAVPHLRERSAQALAAMDLKGYAVGGLAVGEPQEVMMRMIEVVEPHLPDHKPRYLMGVGTPDDIVEAVRTVDSGDGVAILTDMFGGTPSNLAISVMNDSRTEVVAGINLPMLIKLASVRSDSDLDQAVGQAQEAGRKYINVASRVLASK
jgi:hypothetical protein